MTRTPGRTARPGLGAAAVAAALTAALTACGGDADPAASPSPSTTTAAPTTPAPSVTTTTATTGPSCPAQNAPDPAATVITASVKGKTVTTEKHTYSVKLGSKVRLAVTADAADELHVHGYNLHADTTPGCPTALDFTASIPGTVEVELEEAKVHVFEIKAS